MNCFTLPNILVHQRLILTGLAHLKTLSLILGHCNPVTTNYLHISSHKQMALLIQKESFQGFWQAELADGLMAWSTQALPYAQAAEFGKSRWAFLELQCLFHAAFGSCQVKGIFALSIPTCQISPIVQQQLDDFYTGLPRRSMQWGVQTLALIHVGPEF